MPKYLSMRTGPGAAVIGLLILVAAGGLIAILNISPTLDNAARAKIDLALHDAARAQEIHLAQQDAAGSQLATGSEAVGYAPDVALLQDEGLEVPDDIRLTVVRADAVTYCIEARYEGSDTVWHATHEIPSMTEGPC